MELPEIITRLPEIELPLPPSKVRTSLLQSDNGQIVFFEIFEDIDLPAHSHRGQWGTVLEGRVDLTVNGETRTYRTGGSYFIPAGAVHGASIAAGTKLIEFFEESDRYVQKDRTEARSGEPPDKSLETGA